MMRARFSWTILLTALVCGLGIGTARAADLEKINMTLNWTPGGDHSPFFYALKQGARLK